MPRRGISRDGVLAAIREAAQKLGRAPSRVELKQLTGVSHFKVLNHFPSLRQAVRVAGLEPNRKGMRIANRDLPADYGRVAAKLGNPPSRSEYEREGRYSTGAFYRRFGNWRAVEEKYYREQARSNHEISQPSARAMPASNQQSALSIQPRKVPADALRPHGREECVSTSRELGADVLEAQQAGRQEQLSQHEQGKMVAIEWGAMVQALPAPLQGKRKVTEAICMMIVNTLMGQDSNWQMAISQIMERKRQQSAIGESAQQSALKPSTQQSALGIQPPIGIGKRKAARIGTVNQEVVGGKMDREKPVMGPPFFPSVMTNAPDNEMGVMLLFGLLAGELGFQIEAVRGRYPDVIARRQVRPGKWQQVRIELEFESRSFAFHKHDPAKCDVIVCWRHNWRRCPEEIEVIELRRLLGIGQ